ncbi:MAG: hypothetical protein K9J37_14095 [Saprospiraceae bacterium]|nr:hypothetical protein [Saprospiraceae bacterium]MCF8251037.1 hypothetical protein [Saprospiraceae bacterium]MCF8281493.1 hypothetical protein [Bacteroidales bacterium]MCF8311634.1 hypothetical protein [Saprospiraceae bacterium]MCF8440975.1 hypothetical protein [Saprospiraceae bacterium]
MKNTILLCLLACLLGCKPNTSETTHESTPRNGTSLTAEEQKAVLLSGTALSGQATGALSQDGRALELTIAHSAVFDQEPDLLKLHASRAAWVFYKNMGTEKPSYEHLVLVAELQDTTVKFPYSMKQLDLVAARYPAVEEASKMLIDGNYEDLYTLFDPDVMGPSKSENLQSYCTQIEPEYGKPQGFEFRGFSFEKTSSGQDVLSLAGQLKRSIKDTPLNISVDLSKPELKGSLFSIKFAY